MIIDHQPITRSLYRMLFQQKLDNKLGYGLLAGAGLFASALVVLLGWKAGALFTGLMIGLLLTVLCFVNFRFGIAVVIIAAFTINLVSKYTTAPVGTALDALLILLVFSTLVQISRKRDWQFPRDGISSLVGLWIAYNLIQVLNPMAASRMAWLYTVRSLAILQLLYFITHYAIRDIRHIKRLLQLIIGLGLLSALYGIKQEYWGYSAQEWAWLYQSPTRYQLIVQWNRYRVFSLFSDPTTCGTLMAYLGTFCMVLLSGPFSRRTRIGLAIAGSCMYLTMAYAGSRTPFLLLPAALFIFTLLKLNRRVLFITAVFFLLGTALVMKSTSNPVIFRIQSAFRPTTDASVKVRLENQKMIQPFIQTHPFGAGLGSTGVWGERFSPDSWLAGFPHDSAYVRVAIETGSIGLLIYLALFFAAMRTAVYSYFRVADPRIKAIYLALTIVIFMLALASYPQEVATILPNSIVFYVLLAVIVRLKEFDTPGAFSNKK